MTRSQRGPDPVIPNRQGVVVAVACGLLGLHCGPRPSGPLTPGEALESFEIASGFRVELFAAEPHVVDPVEMVFDARGGVYVAELQDNPDDPPTGHAPRSRIKYLEDTDGDGRIDRHTVFADRLLAVEGIAPWRGGLIATAAPDILYLRDTDGDHRADVREVWYTGFGLAHVETRVSNPRLGLDNWFYVVNYGNPGSVRAPARPDIPPVNVRNREFRFHPIRELAEASPGDAQFGHSYNRWGHWFIAQNTVHLRHTVIPPGYLDRNPLLGFQAAVQDISDHGRPAASVYPISQPQRWRVERTRARQRRYAETRPGQVEQLAGYFTAAAGTTVYSGDSFGPKFEDAVFVGEGNGNLVHCDLVYPSGATYGASRWPVDSEFLASRDNWFRPVNFSNAPDGNLYVVDYYREYLEHPDFIPDAVQRRLEMDFRAGEDRGRIYRIVREGSPAQPRTEQLADLSSEHLVRFLAHPNGWHRRTAHRLLLERQDRNVVEVLRGLVQVHPEPSVRLRCMWLLEGLESLSPALVQAALGDPHPSVREAGLRLAETVLDDLVPSVLDATLDENPRVAFQAALTAGSLTGNGAAVAALGSVLDRFPDDPWFHAAALTARPETTGELLAAMAEHQPSFFRSTTPERLGLIRRMARIAGALNDPDEADRILELLTGSETLSGPEWRVAAQEGLAEGLSLHGERVRSPRSAAVVATLLHDESDKVRASAAALAQYFDLTEEVRRAVLVTRQPSVPLVRRLEAASVLRAGPFSEVAPALARLLMEHPEPELRSRAARSLAIFRNGGAATLLLNAWTASPPAVRDVIADSLMRRRSHALALAAAVREGRLPAGEIPTITRIRLSQHPDDSVRVAIAGRLGLSAGGRDHILAGRLAALDLAGDHREGQPLFERECASCHVARASRGRIGPDLTGVANRSREDLLTSILDPSDSIEDRYRNHIVETTDGMYHDGILVAETSSTLTLRAERQDISVLKRNVADLRVSEVSLMPEGFEETFSDQELADLIAYLRAGL